MEAILYFIGTMIMLVAAIIIGSLVLVKDTKKFKIKFGWKGFEVSGSFNNKKKQHRIIDPILRVDESCLATLQKYGVAFSLEMLIL